MQSEHTQFLCIEICKTLNNLNLFMKEIFDKKDKN